jgi:hypothetical protein
MNHYVQLRHGTILGKREVMLDGSLVASGSRLIDFGTKHSFWIGQHVGLVSIRSNGFAFSYDFAIDGWSLGPGEKV